MGMQEAGLRVVLELDDLLEFRIAHACTPCKGGV
jgi:hypothetical protein